MATVTTSGPQEQVPMPSVDLRRMVGQLVGTEGVVSSSDLQVSQRAAGANMSVDVAAGQAYIKDDHASVNAGGYYAATFTAVENVVIPAAHATLPRIDRVVLRVYDAFLADGQNKIQLEVVQGTPTAGATLANLNGAASVPGSALLLANVQVDAAVASIVTAKIDTGSTVRAQMTVTGASAGTQLAYAEFTADVTISATTEATANTIVTAGAISVDGSTPIIVEFGVEACVIAVVGQLDIWLYEDGSSTGEKMAKVVNPAAASFADPVTARRKRTPASGSRTYSIRGSRVTANWTVEGGPAASGKMPGYIRVTKAA
jgi:hypothetical protein